MHTSYVSLAVFAMGAAAVPNMPKADGNPFEGSFPFMPTGISSVDDDDGMSNPVPAYMAAMQAVESAQAGAYNQPVQPKPVEPKPAAPKPASDDNQEFDAPVSQPSDPALNNLIPEITEYGVPSSTSSGIAHVKPSPAFSAVYEYSSSMSIMVSMPVSSSMAPLISQATPVIESMPIEMAPVTINPMPVQSAVQTTITKPSSFVTSPSVKAPAPTSITVPKPKTHSANIHEQHLASMAASSSVMHATPSSSATPSPSAQAVDDSTSMLNQAPVLGGIFSKLAGLF